MSAPAPGRSRPEAAAVRLTDFEREVACLVTAGLSNGQIAVRLRKSPHTVKSCVRRLFRKLRVDSRAQVAARVGASEAKAAAATVAPAEQLAQLAAMLRDSGLDDQQCELLDQLMDLATTGRRP